MGSTALAPGSKSYTEKTAQKALQEFFNNLGSQVKVEIGELPTTYRIRYPLPENPPLVSIITPTRDGVDLLKLCIESIYRKTVYPNFELIVVDNQSSDSEAIRYMQKLEETGKARVLSFDRPFNYSAINNFAARHAKGEILCLLNNDVEVISAEWLNEMVSHAIRPEIGAVGAKLLYPDNTIQHAGVILGIGGVAGHSHKYFPAYSFGYFNRLKVVQNLSAVTGACLVVRKGIYLEVGGLEEDLQIAFNDIDFCLKVREAGYRNLWTPYSALYHHESKSRGHENTPEKQARFRREVEFCLDKWDRKLKNDPFYNPNLTLEHENFCLGPPRSEKAPWKKRSLKGGGVNSYKNDGIIELNPLVESPDEKTIIILGLPRSGTSMVAGALHYLGIFMGERHDSVVFEDVVLSSAVEGKQKATMLEIIKRYDQAHPIWGWKRPSSINFINKISREFRNPHFIIVFRDIFAISNRQRISSATNLFSSLENTISEYRKLVDFIKNCDHPCLLLSYEKCLNNQELTIRKIAEFAGITNPEKIKAAIDFVEPDPAKYLEATRVDRCIGQLEVVTSDKVEGWVRYVSKDEPVTVEMLVDGRSVGKTVANRARPDLDDGNSGFSFDFANGCPLKSGCEIRVLTLHDQKDLKNSPLKCK